MKFAVYLEKAEEGGYTVSVPALPGCFSEGDTKEEALGNIKDAIEGYIKVLKEHGREDEIPKEAGFIETIEVTAA